MAGTFVYRGAPPGMPPGVPPPVTIPDYMSEEKLQEKGLLAFTQCSTFLVETTILYHESNISIYILIPSQLYSKKMAELASKALLRKEKVWLCGCTEGRHAT